MQTSGYNLEADKWLYCEPKTLLDNLNGNTRN